MPNRILRPWTDSEAVNTLSDAAEVFFVRLIQCADDFGRFHGSPMLLKSYLFPLKDKRVADITRWVAECAKAGLIADYEVAGKRFVEIRNFNQRMRLKGKSKFPDPPSPPPPNDGQGTGKRPSNDSHLTAGGGDEDGDDKEKPPAGDKEKHAPAFSLPKSKEEVMVLAGHLYCAMECTAEQANAYFTDRVSRDWIPYGQQKQIHSQAQICADLKKWLMRDLNTQRERQAKDGSKHFCNESSKYDTADDGSNF